MNGDQKFWLSCVITVFTSIVLICTICNYEQNLHYENMMKYGYQQVTIPVSMTTVWQKR